MKRLALVLVALWLGRWAAREAASFGATRWLRYVPRDDDERAPGRMPGPFD